jgi:hypothetical protein
MSERASTKCPYRVGERVRFQPSARTKGLYQNIEGFGVKIGEVVTIEEIKEDTYIYCKGGGGGWPWNEWTPENETIA